MFCTSSGLDHITSVNVLCVSIALSSIRDCNRKRHHAHTETCNNSLHPTPLWLSPGNYTLISRLSVKGFGCSGHPDNRFVGHWVYLTPHHSSWRESNHNHCLLGIRTTMVYKKLAWTCTVHSSTPCPKNRTHVLPDLTETDAFF